MGFKRKRSGASLDSCSSSSGSCSPTRFSDSDAMDVNFTFSYDSYEDATHLNSRTRKRFRDNRPDEQAIYQNTFQKLFNAQRRDFQAPTPALPQPADEPPASLQKERGQASLHSFWKVASRPAPAPPTTLVMEAQEQSRPDSAMGDADVDMDAWGAPSCVACGGVVCGLCSVATGLGDARECLPCRTRPGQRVGVLDWAGNSGLRGALSCSGCGGTLSFLA